MPLKLQELLEADLIVVTANDIPRIIFNFSLVDLQKKVIIWKIKDEQKRNKENIKRIILAIKDKVEELNRRLEK